MESAGFKKSYFTAFALSLLNAGIITVIPYVLQISLNHISSSYSVKVFFGSIMLFVLLLIAAVFIEIQKYISLDRFGGEYISDLLARMQSAVLSQDELKANHLCRNQLDHILYADVLDIFRIIGNYLPSLSSSILIVLLLFVFSLFVDPKISLFLI
jgi:ABC-type transport system involved in cytochrome bd biosynthesis fused ATPase/permease subunit